MAWESLLGVVTLASFFYSSPGVPPNNPARILPPVRMNTSTDLFDNFFKGKRVLLTGDTGFKGSWMSIWLAELGAEVTGYSLPPLTASDNYVRADLRNVIHHHDGDIRDLDHLSRVFEAVQPEVVFHLAAQSLVLPSYRDPATTFSTNILGTVNFFEAVRKTRSVRVAVNVTSDKCYQNNEWDWGYRENDPMGGNDPYSASKGCSELITHAYLRSYFSDGNCFIGSGRAGNVIGGGDWAEHRIIPDVFRGYFSGEDLVLRNPAATRPWQFVLEPIFGYMRLAQMLYAQGEKFSGGWNFGPGAGRDYSVLDVITKIREVIPRLNYRIDSEKNKHHEAKLLKLDISKSMAHLNWRPLLDFEETIKFTADGYLAEKSNDNLYDNRVDQIKSYAARFSEVRFEPQPLAI